MAKAFGRRPSDWVPGLDELAQYQLDRVTWYAGVKWEAEQYRTQNPGLAGKSAAAGVPGADPNRPLIEQKHLFRNPAGPGIKKMAIPESGVW